jgi:hypothetical protein
MFVYREHPDNIDYGVGEDVSNAAARFPRFCVGELVDEPFECIQISDSI